MPTTFSRQSISTACGFHDRVVSSGSATLGLCGWLMQRALRNPLAEPITLRMTSGAT
jgi:hypothetical protein